MKRLKWGWLVLSALVIVSLVAGPVHAADPNNWDVDKVTQTQDDPFVDYQEFRGAVQRFILWLIEMIFDGDMNGKAWFS